MDEYNIGLLATLYIQHGGNVLSLWRNLREEKIEDIPTARAALYRACSEPDFLELVKKERQRISEEYKDIKRIESAEMIAIASAGIKKYAEQLRHKPYLTTYEVEILWRIMKTELGEPINITKNENINHDYYDDISDEVDTPTQEEKEQTEAELQIALERNPLEEIEADIAKEKEENAQTQPE